MNETAIRRDCAEAHAVATSALADDATPPAVQVERLREALAGHVRELIVVVQEEFADAPPGRLPDAVAKTVALAETVLAQPVQGNVLDLLATPPVARLLLLMAEDPDVFGALPERPAPVVGDWEVADAV